MKIDKLNPLHWYYLALQGLYTLAAITLRPFLKRGPRPVVVLYGHHFSGHLAALYRYWHFHDVQDLTFYFLTLRPSPVVAEPDIDVNILLCKSFKDMMTVAGAAAMITDHGLHLMRPLLNFTDIAFIDVGHGIPFKGYDEENFRLRRRYYSEIWTSSREISDLYAKKCGCGHLVHSTGSPRTDKLVGSTTGTGQFRQRFAIGPNDKVVLYAPTWQQDAKQRSLIPFGERPEDFLERCSALCKEFSCHFVFRCHQNASLRQLSFDRVIFCPQAQYPDTEDILMDTDILISDWSSIVFDFLVLDRPTLFIDVPPPFAKGCTLGPEYRFGHVVTSMAELITSLETYIVHPHRYLEEYGDHHRSIKAAVYDNNADGCASERCLDRLQALLTRSE